MPPITTTPSFMYSRPAADRAIERIGRDAYTVLRTKALIGIRRQAHALEGLIGPLDAAVRRQDALEPTDPELPEARRAVDMIGNETHWHAIHRVGQSVESLCALESAMDAYRSGALGQVATLLVHHDLDLQKVLESRTRRKLAYWERLGGRPSLTEAAPGRISAADRKALLAANRRWAAAVMGDFQAIRGFYSPALHQVYTKYRHGYTLVSPTASPLFLETDGRRATDIDHAVRQGFVVMHESREGRRVVHVVETGLPQIHACLAMARTALILTSNLSMAWLYEVEHPDSPTIAFEGPDAELVARWVGPALDDIYPTSAWVPERPEGPPSSPKD